MVHEVLTGLRLQTPTRVASRRPLCCNFPLGAIYQAMNRAQSDPFSLVLNGSHRFSPELPPRVIQKRLNPSFSPLFAPIRPKNIVLVQRHACSRQAEQMSSRSRSTNHRSAAPESGSPFVANI